MTELAAEIFKERDLDVKTIVSEFVAEQLSKSGASYWDAERDSKLEISGDRAEYVASRKLGRNR